MAKKAIVLALLYFIIGFWTLSDYGQNWDEAIHFYRGQAYLHYFVTGEKDYKNLPAIVKYQQKDDTVFFRPLDKKESEIPARSVYEDNQANFSFFQKDYGHPPLSDIFAASFNYIFFQRLRIINDVDSYHLYSLFLASILVGVVFLWMGKRYGWFVGLISALALSSYPLFLGESRYNIKDIPETVFYSLTIITFYEGLTKRSLWWFLASSIFFGFAWATKFNVVFMPVILLIWGIAYVIGRRENIKKYFFLFPALFMYLLIATAIFFLCWPYLWSDPAARFMDVVGYYKQIGINTNFDSRFLTFFRINTYPVQWILYTTPLVSLFLAMIGFFYTLTKGKKEKDKFSLLILVWFLLPILRVSAPNAGIYGGVRHIIEYIPAMSMLSGIGVIFLSNILYSPIRRVLKPFVFLKNKEILILQVFLILSFLPIFIKLISIHPNQGVYFNPIIGGLQGAKDRDLPEWGQSLGQVNKQGTKWLNDNAVKNAQFATNFGLGSSVPTVFLRNDLRFSNVYRSVLERKGEYIMGLTHQSGFEDTYLFQYLDTFLIPLYEVRVDGVSLLKIWKNDLQHTKKEYKEIVLITDDPARKLTNSTMILDIGQTARIAKLLIKFKEKDCFGISSMDIASEGSVEISLKTDAWKTLDGDLRAQSLLPTTTYTKNGDFIYYFAAISARFIRVTFDPGNPCFKNIETVEIFGLKN